MNFLNLLGFSPSRLSRPPEGGVEYLHVQRPLQRIFAFTGYSIDDVVNSRIAKNLVLGHYKLSKEIDRRGEILDLERQWNPLSR